MATFVLLGAFVIAGFVAPALLSRASWPYRSPRLGIAAWLTASVAAVSAAFFGLFTVAVPVAVLGHGMAEWWHACLERWSHYYGRESAIVAAIAAGAAVLMLGRLIQSAISYRRAVFSVRRLQLSGLELFGTAGSGDVVVLPHPAPVAYCVPGRPGRVVMTEGALRALDADQLSAVVAHERAHLSGQHSRWIGVGAILHRGFGWLAPVFAQAARHTEALVEMAADDAAVAICSPRRFAEAIVTVAEAAAPSMTLAASGSDVAARIERLTNLPRPLPALPQLAGVFSLAVALMLPLATVVASAAAAMVAASCPPLGG